MSYGNPNRHKDNEDLRNDMATQQLARAAIAKAEGQRPSFQFYPSDWRKDAGLRSCSLAARSVWIDLLCLAHERVRSQDADSAADFEGEA